MGVPTRIKLLLLGLAAVIVAGSVYIFQNAVTGSGSDDLALPAYVEGLIPPPGSEVLSQSEVGVDLAEGYDAYLVIDGVPITERVSDIEADGLFFDSGRNVVQYNPGPGRRVESLASPESCVAAWVWRVIDGQDTATQTYWCFDVI